jgi:hypothetical protein
MRGILPVDRGESAVVGGGWVSGESGEYRRKGSGLNGAFQQYEIARWEHTAAQ